LGILLDRSDIGGFLEIRNRRINTILEQTRSSYEKCSKRKGPPTEIVQPWDFGVAFKPAEVYILQLFPFTSFLKGDYSNSFYFSPVSEFEISSVISSLNCSKSVGPNSIPIYLLKILNNNISLCLSKIINDSFLHGIFPDKLKIAKVTPIFKKGSRTDKSNYRPISVLSIFSKIFEKLVYKRVYNYLEYRNILNEFQFGFRANRSTSHALLSTIENLKEFLDKGSFGVGLFIDFKKAFDTVNHHILLNKLEFYGFRGVVNKWFQSYLTGRNQNVSINGINSSLKAISCGVPQGSVLGPLLFLLYINDLPYCSNRLVFQLFADDTNIFFSSKNLDLIQTTLNIELKNVSQWLNANRLALNIEKTNFVVFHSPKKKPHKVLSICIDNQSIREATSVKYLGVLIDSTLSWRPHISELSKKIAKSVGILSKLRHYLNTDILISIYYSLIYSFIIYGIEIWGQTYVSYLKPISTLLKKTVRIITFSDYRCHSEQIFKLLNLLKFSDLISLSLLKFVFRWKNKLLPACFANYYDFLSDTHSHQTRQSSNDNIFLTHKRSDQFGRRSIKYSGALLWNLVPYEIKSSSSLSIFSKKIKQYMIDGYSC
jgi:hypothetical protein